MDGTGRSDMALTLSLSGMRNAAAAQTPAGFEVYERPFADGWDVWLAAEWSRVEDNRAGDRASSDFTLAHLGLDYQVSEDLILGMLVQYDQMQERSAEVFTEAGAVAGARVDGEGWMAGPYAVWRLSDQLTFDGLALYGTSDNAVNPIGLYEDGFETDRFMVRANLTGQLQNGPWRLRPQASLTHFEETQTAYTDSLGIAIPEQTLALGRLTAGPELAWRSSTPKGGFVEFNTGVRAVWDYQAAEQLNARGQFTGGDDTLRADAQLGLSARLNSGLMISIQSRFAGLGLGPFEARSLRVELRMPFGASHRAGAVSAFAHTRRDACEDDFGVFDPTHGRMQARACSSNLH